MVTTVNARSALRLTLIAAGALSLAACGHGPKPSYPTSQATQAPHSAEPSRPQAMPNRTEPVTQNALPGSERDFTVNVGDRVYFDYDMSEFREDARRAVNTDADLLKRIFAADQRVNFVIEGHADERGSAEYNLGLADRRAIVTRDALVQLGVPANRLRTVSFGEEAPVCQESNEACWQRNRHAHLSQAQ